MRGGELVVEALQVGEQSLVTAGSSEETQSGLVARANGRLVEESVSSRPACSDSGLRDMPVLKVLCPNKKRPFSTGVDIRVEEKASLPNIRKFSQCPHCQMAHGWTPEEAFFDDPPATFFWIK